MGQRKKLVVLNSNRAEILEMLMNAPAGTEVEIKYGNPHTAEQRAKMRCMLRDIATQATWYGVSVPEEHWKNLFSAELKRELIYPGIHCGFVMSGEPTRDMSTEEMAGMIDLMHAFGIERGIVFREDAAPNPKDF